MKKWQLNNKYFWIMAVMISGVLKSQTTSTSIIHQDKSKLLLAKDSSLFLKFYQKMDEMQEGKKDRLYIAQMGGSHTQGGLWAEQLMNGFQGLGNYSGGGVYIFPFKIVRSNTPSFYRSFGTGKWKRCRSAITKELCNNLGVSGMAAITNDSLTSFGFKLLATSNPKSFNSLKVYHNFNSNFKMSLTDSTLRYQQIEFKENGYSEFVFENEIDSIQFKVLRLDTLQRDFVLRGMSAENKNRGFYYATLGVNGASTSSFLRCTEFTNDLKVIPPDMVIFCLGVNDTHDMNFTKERFIANYDSLVNQIKKVSPDCAFLFVTTTDNYIRRKTPNKRPIKAAEAAYELAEKHKGAVYDLYAVMGGYKSIYRWYRAGYASRDKVHFSGKGYRIIGSMMFDAIRRNYQYNSKLKK